MALSNRALRRGLTFAVFLAVCGLSFAFSDSVGAQQTGPGQATLSTLEGVTIPARNRIDLAERLQGVTNVSAAPTQPLHVYKVGDTAQFWCTNEDENKEFQVTATLVYATPHIFMWFENGSTPEMAAVKQSADTFETLIYPTEHKYYGSERSPGIDGDVHLYILHAHNLGASVGGYFSSADTYPTAVVKYSNEHNMFFVNLDNATGADAVGARGYEGTLAHEFQHMIEQAVHPGQSWMNEGLSETARLVTGYADQSFAPEFLSNPITQLDTWEPDPNTVQHYGAGYLFGAYYIQRFGPDKVHTLIADPAKDLFSFDDALKAIQATDPSTNQPITTTDLYADWQAANLIQNPKLADGRYGYKQVPETLTPAHIAGSLSTGTHSLQTRQYGTVYLQLKQPGTYTLNFTGQPTVKVIPTDAHSGTHFWWAGREDESDARLTHDFDLSTVKSATLDFWTWYSIENEWDYGYVEVSTDGGKTWKVQAAPNTDNSDPYGNSYGPGFTGVSGAGANNTNSSSQLGQDSQAQWIEEKVDLSAYAGQQIKVRFEYVTDDELTFAGMAIDDIQIPEIGYSSDAETDDGGWQSEGWARMDNTLPETYLIQEIDFGSTPTVKRLLSPADGVTGKWVLKVDASTPHLVIAVSGMTRFSDEDAPFSYTLAAAR